jgi:hypothetical protein
VLCTDDSIVSDITTGSTAAPDLAQLQARIDRLAKDCEAWRASGQEEKYMAAFCAIGALELKRDRRLSQLRSGG